jgi:hypothetical protein
LSHQGHPEIAQEQGLVFFDEHIVRFKITMDKLVIVSILQAIDNLPDIFHDRFHWQLCIARMALTQGALGSILHDQVRNPFILAKIEDTDNMRMNEMGQNARFLLKSVLHIGIQARIEDFDGGQAFQMNMLAQIDIGEASLSQQLQQAIVPYLLSNALRHHYRNSFFPECCRKRITYSWAPV